MAYIEPCCCERQLPQCLKSGMSATSGNFVFFHTNGDVLLEHLLKSVSYMAGAQNVLLLSIPEVDGKLLRTLNHYLVRGWTKAVMLLTRQPQVELIESELQAYIDRVQYASDPLILDGMLAIMPAGEMTNAKAVVIQGAMLSKQDFSLCHYAAWTGTDRKVLLQAIEPLLAKLHTKARIDHQEQENIAMVLNRKF